MHSEAIPCHHRGDVWLDERQKCQVTLRKRTALRGWLRLQRCKHITDEKQTRVASRAAPPHLHMVHTHSCGSISWWRSIKGGNILTFKCTHRHLSKYDHNFHCTMCFPVTKYKNNLSYCYYYIEDILPNENLDKSQILPWEIPFCPHAHCHQHQAFWKQYEILYGALQQQCTVSLLNSIWIFTKKTHTLMHLVSRAT